jgi:hypothetical protein
MGLTHLKGDSMGKRKSDDILDKLYPFIVDIQTSLDRYVLYMVTMSLLKISIGDRNTINAILDKWLTDFFNANVDTVQAKVSEAFGPDEHDDVAAPLHLIALQSVTNVAKKTLMDLLEAIESFSANGSKYQNTTRINH